MKDFGPKNWLAGPLSVLGTGQATADGNECESTAGESE